MNWYIESESNPMLGEYVLNATFAEACRRKISHPKAVFNTFRIACGTFRRRPRGFCLVRPQ